MIEMWKCWKEIVNVFVVAHQHIFVCIYIWWQYYHHELESLDVFNHFNTYFTSFELSRGKVIDDDDEDFNRTSGLFKVDLVYCSFTNQQNTLNKIEHDYKQMILFLITIYLSAATTAYFARFLFPYAWKHVSWKQFSLKHSIVYLFR